MNLRHTKTQRHIIRRWPLALLLASLLQCPAVHASWDNPLDEFFPEWQDGLQGILREQCAGEYERYLANRHEPPVENNLLIDFHMTSQTYVVVECMLSTLPEVIKFKLAAAQVLLGLMPTLLASLGVSPHETGTIAVVARRPILAMLLAWGSPAVMVARANAYTDTLSELPERRIKWPMFLRGMNTLMLLVEYAIAALAVANIIELAHRIGARSLFAVLPNAEYMAMLWVLLGVTLHAFGALGVFLTTQVGMIIPEEGRLDSLLHGAGSLRSHPIEVARTYTKQPFVRPRDVHVTILNPTLRFLFTSWFTSVYSATYVLFGTILFSSTLFVSVDDAIFLVLRMMASAVASRVVMSYELAVLADQAVIERKNNRDD